MSWITITLADLNEARAAELVTALRTEALGAGQADPMPGRIQTVIDEIRRAIAFYSSNPLDADSTKIPTSAKEIAVGEIVGRLKQRLLMALSEDEVRAEKRYYATLDKFKAGAEPVDTTDNPIATSPVQASGGSQVVCNPCRIVTRDSLNGL
jgi:hypothetical protein